MDPAAQGPWHPDPILGPEYVQRTLRLVEGPRGDGPVATLVHRCGAATSTPPVLVLHGWSDYVFQRDLLDHLAARGHDVWALDLRRHGRSLRPGQVPTAVDDLDEYDDELGQALAAIGRDRPPVILAHSTGALVAVRWAARHPATVRALALNSPWLEMHGGSPVRRVLHPAARRLARRSPARAVLPAGLDHYARSLHVDFGGEFDFDLAWKPPGGHPLTASTLAAVMEAQRRLRRSRLDVPVLVLRSDRSRFRRRFDDRMRTSDVVLDVRAMDRAARRLGPRVRVVVVPGARHDVFLSDTDARDRATAELDAWFDTLP